MSIAVRTNLHACLEVIPPPFDSLPGRLSKNRRVTSQKLAYPHQSNFPARYSVLVLRVRAS
jgi:hypothetical protein